MTSILEFCEKMNNIYVKYGRVIRAALKCILTFMVLTSINNYIGYDQRLNSIMLILICCLISAVMHPAMIVLLAAAFSIMHVYYSSPVLAAVLCTIYIIMYLLIIRFMPYSGYIVLAVPILFILKIPFAAPILLGLILSPFALVPCICGVVIYYLFDIIKSATTVTGRAGIDEALENYKYVIDGLRNNKEMILVICIFTGVLIVTYCIRKLAIDYAFTIAIIAGVIMNILAFLIGNILLNISGNTMYVLIGSIIAGILVWIIQFFRLNLDYSAIEYTQFEDDDYYYYVKAVPKVKIAAPKKDLKRINGRKEEVMEEQENLDSEEEEFYSN